MTITTTDRVAYQPHQSTLRSWPRAEEIRRFPFAYFREARCNSPVIRLGGPAAPDVPMYLATRHPACVRVLIQPRLFASDLADVLSGFNKSKAPPPITDRPTLHDRLGVFSTEGQDHKIKRVHSVHIGATLAANRDPDRFPVLDNLPLECDNIGREHLSLERGVHRRISEPAGLPESRSYCYVPDRAAERHPRRPGSKRLTRTREYDVSLLGERAPAVQKITEPPSTPSRPKENEHPYR